METWLWVKFSKAMFCKKWQFRFGKTQNLKKIGAPTALLVPQHEEFQDGMDKKHCKYWGMTQTQEQSHL